MSEKIVQFNEEIIKGQIKELVRGSVEETLNELLENMGQGTVLCPTIMDSGVPGQVGRGTVPCPTHCPTRKSGTQNRPLSHAAILKTRRQQLAPLPP